MNLSELFSRKPEVNPWEIDKPASEIEHIRQLRQRINNILYRHPNANRETVIYFYIDDHIHLSHGLISGDTTVFVKGELVFSARPAFFARTWTAHLHYIPGEWEQYLAQLEAAL